MFRFFSPSTLNWLFLIPAIWLVVWIWGRAIRGKLTKAFGSRITPFLTSSVSTKKRKIKLLLQSAVIGLLIIAWARPQAGDKAQQIKSEGVEIMLLIDVSDSMLAEDVRPNRLGQARIELSRLIEKMPGHKIGVIAFAGTGALLSPLTTDPAALKMYIDSLSTLSVSTQGTCFKCGLSEAKAAFERGGADNSPTTRVTRVILIASDGEDHEQEALSEAEKLAKEGTRIFALAYGTERGGPIPERDSLGFLKGNKRDRSGKEVTTAVKGDALKALANAGKGSFYHASFGGNHIDNVIEDINKLEKTEFDSQLMTQFDEKFQIFLLLAFLLGCLEIALGERQKAGRIWRGRYEVPAT